MLVVDANGARAELGCAFDSVDRRMAGHFDAPGTLTDRRGRRLTPATQHRPIARRLPR